MANQWLCGQQIPKATSLSTVWSTEYRDSISTPITFSNLITALIMVNGGINTRAMGYSTGIDSGNKKLRFIIGTDLNNNTLYCDGIMMCVQ